MIKRFVQLLRRAIRSRRRRSLLILVATALAPVVAFRLAVMLVPYRAAMDPVPSTFVLDREGNPIFATVASDGQWRIPLRWEGEAPAEPVALQRLGSVEASPSRDEATGDPPMLSHDAINADLMNAVVAVEDSRFYEHAGVDWRSVVGAAFEDLRHLSIRRGASTLSMQLARLRDPRPRTVLAKIDQAIRAEQIEKHQHKREILIEYLNRAPFGGNLTGAGAASWRYFNKSCSQLSLAQCALLAGLPQSPNRLRPDRYPDRAKARRDHVLDRMLALGMISRTRHDQAIAEPIDARWTPLPENAPSGQLRAGDHGISRDPAQRENGSAGASPSQDRLASLAPLITIAQWHRGQIVRSTIDPIIQSQATRIARKKLDELAPDDIGSAAVVVLDTQTAELFGAVSMSTDAPNVDLTRTVRSTGSTLKPFIYAAAFDAGVCRPDAQLTDAPTAWSGYSPANYDREFRGELTAAEALAESRNLPAMTVLSRVGVPRCIEVMDGMGLHSLARKPERYGLPLAIGGAEASPMEIAEAYATLARGGRYRNTISTFSQSGGTDIPVCLGSMYSSPRMVRRDRPRVTASDDRQECLPHRFKAESEVGNAHPAQTAPVLLPDASFASLSAIADADRTAAICPEAASSHTAWKTGTSSGHRDAWCAAVTRRFTVVVWLGNATGRSSSALVGADAAAPVALSIIAAIDPADDPWPVSNLPQSPTRFASAPESLSILSPADQSEIIVTGERQKTVELRAAAGASDSTWWFVDGTSIGTGRFVEWLPMPGPHEIRLLDDAGRSAVARIRVR